MKVEDLINKLQEFPSDAIVILAEELGASELEDGNVRLETMNYVEYPPNWEHFPPSYGWEYPSEYERKILTTKEVAVISYLVL